MFSNSQRPQTETFFASVFNKINNKKIKRCLPLGNKKKDLQHPEIFIVFVASLFRIARAGIFPRSSLLGAEQLGFWEFGEDGTVG
jgi:hypothetical protein